MANSESRMKMSENGKEPRGNAAVSKSFAFAVRIVKLCRHLRERKNETVLSKQLLRAGTSVGANVAESQEAFSEKDFAAKLSVARKEAGESEYWLRLLFETGYLSKVQFDSIFGDAAELRRILSSIVLTLEKKGREMKNR